MKTTSHLPAAAFLAIVAFSTSLLAQTEALPNTPTPSSDTDTPRARQADRTGDNNKLSRADRNFFEEAAKSGMKEVEVSNAVKGRLANTQVNAFAEMMVADHTAANAELQALASRKGIMLPADKKDYTEKWTKKDGKIDEDYIETMEDDHEKAVRLFEKASKSEDPEIAAFAQKTLPKLQHHLDQARTLKQTVK
jgi:putative membrane protein